MQVLGVRGLDRVSAEIRAAEVRLEGHQAELVPVRKLSGSYNIVYWTTQKSQHVPHIATRQASLSIARTEACSGMHTWRTRRTRAGTASRLTSLPLARRSDLTTEF